MKMKMSKKSNGDGDDGHINVGRRPWMLLRLALLWARKGGAFKRRLMMELRVVPKFLKSLANVPQSHKHINIHNNIHYFERQLSFDKTPIFPTLRSSSSSSSMRFLINNIPCLNPPLVLDHFDHDEVDMIINNHDDHDHNYSTNAAASSGYAPYDDDDDDDDDDTVSAAASNYNYNNYEDDESVDKKADEFIAKFYQQIKLQRQISYIHYVLD